MLLQKEIIARKIELQHNDRTEWELTDKLNKAGFSEEDGARRGSECLELGERKKDAEH